METILETQDLSIRFGGLEALKNFNFNIQKSEIVGIVGPNGAGKTTILNLISGVYRPTSGRIVFQRNEIGGMRPHKITHLGISRTFQNIRLIPSLSVLENVMLGSALRIRESILDAMLMGSWVKKRRGKWVQDAKDMLEYVGLKEVLNMEAVSLPYGKQREVEIARAIATRSTLLLLDEPAAGMSKKEKQNLIKLVRKLRDEMGMTIIIIEHDIKMVLELVDRVAVLDFGVKIADDEPNAVKSDPMVIKAYLGVEE
jgi:branched-chain amino acid transport system ATP-binding protein